MARQEILPACLKYTTKLADGVKTKKAIGVDTPHELALVKKLSSLTEELIERIGELESVTEIPEVDAYAIGMYYKDNVIPAMTLLRETADTLEGLVAKDFWPFPTYTELLYQV